MHSKLPSTTLSKLIHLKTVCGSIYYVLSKMVISARLEYSELLYIPSSVLYTAFACSLGEFVPTIVLIHYNSLKNTSISCVLHLQK